MAFFFWHDSTLVLSLEFSHTTHFVYFNSFYSFRFEDISSIQPHKKDFTVVRFQAIYLP